MVPKKNIRFLEISYKTSNLRNRRRKRGEIPFGHHVHLTDNLSKHLHEFAFHSSMSNNVQSLCTLPNQVLFEAYTPLLYQSPIFKELTVTHMIRQNNNDSRRLSDQRKRRGELQQHPSSGESLQGSFASQ